MCIAKRVTGHGVNRNPCSAAWFQKIKKALDIYGLPSSCGLPIADLTKAITLDKKNLNGNLNVVLLKEIGDSYVYPTDISFFNKDGAI